LPPVPAYPPGRLGAPTVTSSPRPAARQPRHGRRLRCRRGPPEPLFRC